MRPDWPTVLQYFPAEGRHRQQYMTLYMTRPDSATRLHAIIWHPSDGLLGGCSQEAGCILGLSADTI